MSFRSLTLSTNDNPRFTKVIDSLTDQGNTLLYNSDLTNTVWVTDQAVGNPATVDAGPIPPNGNLVVDGSKDIYAFCTSGTPTLYSYPSGVGSFRALTQALGQLAIPSVRSPNYS